MARLPLRRLDQTIDLALAEPDERRQPLQRRPHTAAASGTNRDPKALYVRGEHPPAPVENAPPPRQQRPGIDAITLRQHPQPLPLDDLQVIKPSRNRPEGHRLQAAHDHRAPRQPPPVRIVLAAQTLVAKIHP